MATAISIAVLLLAVGPAEGTEQQDKSRQEEVARIAPAQAMLLELHVGQREPVEVKLHREPLLRWSNPIAGSVYGEVFLWTAGDRPAAIASIYRWYHPYKDSTVEIVSLSEQSVTAGEGEKTQWQSPAGGVQWRLIDDAPRPAGSRSSRLSQMRLLARSFSAELSDRRGGEEVSRKLRLLEQPVFRYGTDAVDGALFAFVETTDPEAWLLLETDLTGAEGKWQFALARMNIDQIRIRQKEAVVKEFPGLRDAWTDRKTPYVMFNFDPDKLSMAKEPGE
jgi:hypothetical protein